MSPAPSSRPTTELQFAVGLAATALLGVAVTLMAWAVVPSMLPGWSVSIVESGSMSPLVQEGDAVVVRPPSAESIDPGTVILFDTGTGATLHRVEQVDAGGYVTRGDANGVRDSAIVAPSEVSGVGAVLVPLVGQPRRWMAEQRWGLLLGFVVVSALVVHTSRWAGDPRLDPWSTDPERHRLGDPGRPLVLGDPVLSEPALGTHQGGLLSPALKAQLLGSPGREQ